VEVDKLFDSRTRYGVKARAGAEPGCPVYAEQMPPSGQSASAASPGSPERFYVTREELVGMVDEALRARGVS
jgi:L-fuculose-phosphate aldolase